MLDHRLYRAALVPAVLVLAIVAFSLAQRPTPATTPLTTEAFDAARAFGGDPPPPESLQGLLRAFPRRRPGSSGDHALGSLVARRLGQGRVFTVRSTHHDARTPDGILPLTTVLAVRAGASNRRVVVVAHRDALAPGSAAELSATAVLLELGRLFQQLDLRKTLVLASTSGGAGGAGLEASLEDFGQSGDIDGVLVLGDLASRAPRRPFVVPWRTGGPPAPLALQRTVEAAVRQETGADGGASRAVAQWMRRALPLTLGEQGAAGGVPAVLLSATGERGPAPRAQVSRERLRSFGRAALRAVIAMDQAGAAGAGAFAGQSDGLVTVHRVLPGWAVRLLVLALLLPVWLSGADLFFRARRRGLELRAWVLWLGAGAVPVIAAWLWARLLGAADLVSAPPGPVAPAAYPLGGWRTAAFVAGLVILGAGWVIGPRLARARLGLAGRSPAEGGAIAALGMLLAVTSAGTWIANPWAAMLLVPACHLWLLAASAPGHPRRGAAALIVLVGLAAPGICLLVLAGAFGVGPLGLAWTAFLLAAGGVLSPLEVLAAAALAAATAGTAAILLARARRARATPPQGTIRTRGPVSYAGPGSLGGTDSALRF